MNATKNIDVVFHVAGLVSYSPLDYALMEEINVRGTANVLKASIENKVGRLIFTSSVVAVGASSKKEILNEESSYDLGKYKLAYYDTKRRAEGLVLEASRKKEIEAVVLNPSVMFGPGDVVKGSRKTHLKVIKGKFPFYPPGGVNVMHVGDAVHAHINAIKMGRSGERYILSGDNLSVHEFFRMLANEGGHRAPRVALPKWFLKMAFYFSRFFKIKTSSDSFLISTLFHFYDSSKARRELDFNPRPAIKGIEDSISWSRAHGFLEN